MKSLIKKIVRRRSRRRSLRKQKRDSKLVTKVIGTASLPVSLVDTAHLSILNYPAEEDGVVTDLSLRLGAAAPGDGTDWEVRIYQKSEIRSFVLRGKQSINVDTNLMGEQHIKITPPLPIRRGQFIGLVNKSGRLSLTYTRGWTMQRGTTGDIWDLWYLEEQPLHRLGSMTPPLLMWNGSVGWFAKMAQDPPEPRLVLPVSTLVADMRRILDDSSTMDVTFFVGPDLEPVCAHRAIIKARCKFFDTLLSGGFIEEGKQEVQIPDSEPHLFRLMLEYLYTNNIEGLGPHDALLVLQLACKYCIDGLAALCETTVKPYVDYDNVATIFHICAQCEASQLLAYCVYFARKFEPRLCREVTPETAPQLFGLAKELGLLDLKKAAEPLAGPIAVDDERHVGCGERKLGHQEDTFRPRPSLTTRKPPPPIVGRERMWSA